MIVQLTTCETPELEVESMDFGSESGPRFEVDIADRPIGLPLRGLFRAHELSVPAEYALYKRFALWVIPHRISVRRMRGIYDLVSLTISARFDAGGGTCSVVSLFPEARFKSIGALKAEASISLSGSMTPPTQALKNLHDVGGSLSVGMSGGVEASLAFQAAIATPIISAGGKGSSACYWTFEKDDLPLFGRDIEAWSVLVLPKRATSVEIRMTVTTTERLAFVPVSRSTDEQTISCELLESPV
jgi:hypothetical protein